MGDPKKEELRTITQDMADEALQLFLETARKYERSQNLNVLIVGPVGSGKSSFINTYRKAAYGTWQQVALEAAVAGDHVTTRLQAYYHVARGVQGAEPLDHDGVHATTPLPNIWDFAGLEPEESSDRKLLLRAILYGVFPSTTTLKTMMTQLRRDRELLDKKVQLAAGLARKMFIDCVIVTMAAHRPVLTDFLQDIEAVANAPDDEEGNCFRHTIPIFGLITNHEKASSDYEAEKKKFTECLKINKDRLLEITNYNEEHGDRREASVPAIDLPVLRFMTNIICPYNYNSATPDVSNWQRAMAVVILSLGVVPFLRSRNWKMLAAVTAAAVAATIFFPGSVTTYFLLVFVITILVHGAYHFIT